jgi:hypothetical protein
MILAACSLAASGGAMIVAVLAASAFLKRGTWDTAMFVLLAVLLLATGLGVAVSRMPTGRYPDR